MRRWGWLLATASTCFAVPGCGGGAAGPTAVRPSFEPVARTATQVVVQRDQKVSIPLVIAKVPRNGQLNVSAFTPDAKHLDGTRLRVADGQDLSGVRLTLCLQRGRLVEPAKPTPCRITATGPGTWTVVINASASVRASLGTLTASNIHLASGTREKLGTENPKYPSNFRPDARYTLRDTSVTVQVVSKLPAVTAPADAGTTSVSTDAD